MTTIAFDGTHVASDSLISCNGMIYGYTKKIFQVRGGWLATSGSLDDVELAKNWFENGCLENEKPSLNDFVGLFIPHEGEPKEFSARLIPTFVVLPYAIGSGACFAYSAMKLGKTAIESVEFACEIDLLSGGKIDSVKVR